MNNNKTNETNKINSRQIKQLISTLNPQVLPTNMNSRFCDDMIKELQISHNGQVSGSFTNEDLVYITSRGHLYRKKKFTYDGVTTKHEWTILHNNNGACGWYRTNSPALETRFGGIIMSDGSFAGFQPTDSDIKIFHISHLRYCLVSPMSQEKSSLITGRPIDISPTNVGKEEIYIYISLQEPKGELLLGYMYPLVHHNELKWTTAPNIMENNVFDGWKNSYKLVDLPFYEPQYGESLPVFFKESDVPKEPVDPPPETYTWDLSFDLGPLEGVNTSWDKEPIASWDTEPLTPWGHVIGEEEEDIPTKDMPTQDTEYRWDPSDGGAWYSNQEFVDYYGDEFMWNVCNPEKHCKRVLIENMIERGQYVLPSNQMNYLLDKIIETFM
jgi:hypothetical protein